jgi:hypothetical protein
VTAWTPVGDRANRILGDHAPGYLSVVHSHAVGVSRPVQRHFGHVQRFARPSSKALEGLCAFLTENAADHVQRELVVTGGYRSVSREDALLAYCVQVVMRRGKEGPRT